MICILKGKMPFKMHKIMFFPENKNNFKKFVPTLPKIFRPVTRNTFFYYLALWTLVMKLPHIIYSQIRYILKMAINVLLQNY